MMRQKRFFASIVVATLLGGGIAVGGYQLLTLQPAPPKVIYEPAGVQQPIQLATLGIEPKQTSAPDLVYAAQVATPAVVHIKASYEAKTTHIPRTSTPFDRLLKEFFGEEFDPTPREYKSQPQQATGSGVIIAAEGYIVTNRHVIEGADQLEVTLDDNRRYKAQLVGQDPDTDLALLKIEEKGLAYLQFGNSDDLQVGEWVLAVGNPFNLTSTVTKGIVSAKARNINMLQPQDKMRIESFIQTDAAVNRGNSGGALVNLKGELVGINSAIAAPTGTFAGYAFAIPSSIVKKVTDDLKKYGAVQHAILGVTIQTVDADLAEAKGLKRLSGVYIAEVNKKEAAEAAGIQAGDVIVAINGEKIKNTSQLYEQIALYKPNDKIRVTLYRKDKEKTVTVILKSRTPEGKIELGGATFENLQQFLKSSSNIAGRVRLKTLKEGPWKQAGIKPGFILTAIDNERVTQVDQLKELLEGKKKAFLVEGFYQGGTKVYYGVDLAK